MAAAVTPRHEHLRIDQSKLGRARQILGTDTETATLDQALALVVSEDAIDATLRELAGRGSLTKIFR